MSFFDFNDADTQQSDELLPAKTMCKVVMIIRPGGYGDDGWRRYAESGFEYLDCELTVSSTPYAKKKLWQNVGVGGPNEGHQKAAQISRALLRAALESARGIDPKDESDSARQARQVNGWEDFSGLEFAIEVGIEKDKTGKYPDKNKIHKVITPDHSKYNEVMAGNTIIPEGVQQKKATPSQGQQPAWGGGKTKQAESKPANPVPAWAQ
ncbi:MAG: hypothetical protein K9K82_14220 [Desulfobacteraceae bacterium]|nr:hypothetical protein [Desulfobacteraceae bacterium]